MGGPGDWRSTRLIKVIYYSPEADHRDTTSAAVGVTHILIESQLHLVSSHRLVEPSFLVVF